MAQAHTSCAVTKTSLAFLTRFDTCCITREDQKLEISAIYVNKTKTSISYAEATSWYVPLFLHMQKTSFLVLRLKICGNKMHYESDHEKTC